MIKKNVLGAIFIGVLAVVVMIGTKMPYYADTDDERFIPVMKKLSSLVPQNETIVASQFYGNMVYFMNQTLLIPYNMNSTSSLATFMAGNNYDYLIVQENCSRVEKLKDLFHTAGLNNLKMKFTEIADYSTEQYRYHLYKIGQNSTFHKMGDGYNMLTDKWKRASC